MKAIIKDTLSSLSRFKLIAVITWNIAVQLTLSAIRNRLVFRLPLPVADLDGEAAGVTQENNSFCVQFPLMFPNRGVKTRE